jgi:tRNA1Val (adenine37-N6)-methyltransferase
MAESWWFVVDIMANSFFQFKEFTIHQDRCAMKVTTDSCLFGAWVAVKIQSTGSKTMKLLDIGTGTGLLGLMQAQKNPSLTIDAIEIDGDAAAQAAQNVAGSPWKERLSVIHADAKVFASGEKYDIIISNPPFYEKELKGDNVRKNLAHHNEGLLLPELMTLISKNLTPGGHFFLLLPYKRNAEIRKLVIDLGMFFEDLLFVRQTPRHDYFRMLVQGKRSTTETIKTNFNEITIKGENEKYTEAFQFLLRDYYLHL